MSFSKIVEEDKEIIDKVKDEYLAASFFLPYSSVEIKSVFQEEDELKELAVLIEDIRKATTENEKRKVLINNIQRFASPLLKLLKLGKIVV